MVVANPDGAFRCTHPASHIGHGAYIRIPCNFEGQEATTGICYRRSTRHGIISRTRYCSLTEGHDGLCVYLPITERDATPFELRMETTRA